MNKTQAIKAMKATCDRFNESIWHDGTLEVSAFDEEDNQMIFVYAGRFEPRREYEEAKAAVKEAHPGFETIVNHHVIPDDLVNFTLEDLKYLPSTLSYAALKIGVDAFFRIARFVRRG